VARGGQKKNEYSVLVTKAKRKRSSAEPRLDLRTILKYCLKSWDGSIWTGLIWLRREKSCGLFGNGTDIPGFV
jgi:hypothetical protein